MEEGVVTRIADLAQTPIEIGGFIARPDGYVIEDPAALVKPGPKAAPLKVARLGALRDYLKANRDSLDLAKIVIHVESPALVTVLGPLDPRSRVREAFLTATALDTTDGFLAQVMALEAFIIGLQTRFSDAEDRNKLLALLGTVKHEQVKTSQDDGITQSVTARAGIALVAEVAVPNPIRLVPFRTFRDIVQPPSAFVVRLQSGRDGGLPTASLFEADAGTWRLTAVERVAGWLEEHLADVTPKIAILA